MYQQITLEQRYLIGKFRRENRSIREIAYLLERAPSTISRELRRNRRKSGFWTAEDAQGKTNSRRSKSRRKEHFTVEAWAFTFDKIAQEWAPEQVSLWLKKNGEIAMSTKTIYRYIRKDRQDGGTLYTHLRQARKKRRKGYRTPDSRGRLSGKRPLVERPREANRRLEYGHYEVDLVLGKVSKHCALTLVDRKTRFTLVRKLNNKTVEEVNCVLIPLISKYGIKTLTADNGCEFHGFKEVEAQTGVRFYFARPHHSWERGTSENTNGLIRQYLPKGKSMKYISEDYMAFIEDRLNNRPRKILEMQTPNELTEKLLGKRCA